MLALTANIGPGKIPVMLAQIAEPSSCCLIVMSTCVNNTIPLISVRQIRTVLILIKSKLQYLHSRESGFFHHLDHTVCKEAKILCDHIQLSKILFKRTEQIHSRSLFPVTELGSFISVRNGIILIKASEMVNPYHIIKLHTICHSACPPCIACFLVIFPIIKRISPELPCSGKSIRRASGNADRNIFLIKLEQFRLCPGVRTVKRNVDRDVSDHLHSLIICISFQCCPLFKKAELLETVKSHFFCKLLSFFSQCSFFSVFEFRRPFDPADSIQAVLDCHIQAVIFQPGSIFFYKLPVLLICLTVIIFKGFSQKPKSGIINLLIIHIALVCTPVTVLAITFIQISLFYKSFQINKIRISRKGRKRLVW